jgi:coenzyme F420-reducing hydrogenase gamma subunit
LRRRIIDTLKATGGLREVRAQSKALITIGACATSGGIQALRNFRDHPQMMAAVYAHPEYIATLATSTAIASHVNVDFELRGCPIDKRQLLELVSAFLHGRKPNIQSHSTCIECKLRGTVCVMVAKGQPCLGPVTHAGCGALCPTYARGCYGCFGPSDAPNPRPLAERLLVLGATRAEVKRLFSTFNAAAAPFRDEAHRDD